MMRQLLIIAAVMASISPLLTGGQADPGVSKVEDLVVLLTDYGTCDYYVGALEGSIYSTNPGARISTITHQVSAFNVAEGSYILGSGGRGSIRRGRSLRRRSTPASEPMVGRSSWRRRTANYSSALTTASSPGLWTTSGWQPSGRS